MTDLLNLTYARWLRYGLENKKRQLSHSTPKTVKKAWVKGPFEGVGVEKGEFGRDGDQKPI